MRHEGFTLLEILVVLAIIGIMAAVFTVNLLHSMHSAQLREAANQVASDLRRARSAAQRGSTDITITTPGTSGGDTYIIGTRAYTTLHNVKLHCKTNCTVPNTFTYTAPYGEVVLTGKILTLLSPYSNVPPLEIRVVGVTGKVILAKAP